jgi:hypothetical protein
VGDLTREPPKIVAATTEGEQVKCRREERQGKGAGWQRIGSQVAGTRGQI